MEKKVKDDSNGSAQKGARPNLEMYATTLSGIQEQVRFADSKAGFIAALNVILFGFVASNFEGIRLVYDKFGSGNAAFRIAVAILTLYLIATAISIVQVILAVVSRFGELAPQSKVFFGHIIKSYGKDYSKYVRETLTLSDRDWAEEIGTQIVEVSHIALTKHKLVRRAAWFTLLAFGGWLISLIAIAFLPVVKP